VIGAAALVIRIVAIATVAARNPDGGDPLYYHVQANLLSDGHGFAEPFTWLYSGRVTPSAMHPPLFSMVLSVSSLFGATGFFAHKVVASLVGVGASVMSGLLGRTVAGRRTGLVAAGVVAIHPGFWVIDGILMPEGLFALTVAASLLAAYKLAQHSSARRAALLGAAIGLATLARGEGLLLAPLLLVPLARHAWRHAALALAAAAAVLAPWLVRNALVFDAPVVVSVNANEVIRNANCDLTWHGDLLGFWAYACYGDEPPEPLDQAERGEWFRERGLEYIAARRDRVPVVVAARVGRVWELYRPFHNTHLATIEGRNLQVARAGLFAYWATLPLAALGVLTLRRRAVSVWPLLSPFVAVTVTAALAYGATRFRVPADVALAVLSAVGLVRGVDWLAHRRR
jgi:4-amino-4-deoxy-L-arabinose transferase-like glycosyltransferase